MATKLESLSTKLQSALDLANSLPDAITLDELTNPGSADTMLEGTEMLDAQGKKVTGTIESKDSSDLTASGAMVTVPAGYYAEDASKSVSSGSVNQPTITVDSSGNVKATVSYSSGYISSGSMYGTKALGTGSVSVSGPVVTASAGYYPSSVRKTISSGSVPSPTITVDEDGLITAKTSVSGGYVYVGTKTGTKQLDTQPATTITPTKSSQTAVEAGKYTTGAVTVGAIPDEYIDTSDANATAPHILAGETAYVDGVKVTGTMVNHGSDNVSEHFWAYVSPTPNGQTDVALLVNMVDGSEGYYKEGAYGTWPLESVTVTPTKSQQEFAEASNFLPYGKVTVNPIPDEYQDVSNVTATAARTAAGDVFVDADGVEQTGRLRTDRIAITKDSDGYIIQDGSMDANIYDDGNVAYLSVNRANFGNTDPSKVLADSTFTAGGYYAESGTMPNNGTLSSTIDGLETKSVSIPKGYTDGGTVALDSTIDDTADSQAAQIAEIKAMLEGKSVSGGSGMQVVTGSFAGGSLFNTNGMWSTTADFEIQYAFIYIPSAVTSNEGFTIGYTGSWYRLVSASVTPDGGCVTYLASTSDGSTYESMQTENLKGDVFYIYLSDDRKTLGMRANPVAKGCYSVNYNYILIG